MHHKIFPLIFSILVLLISCDNSANNEKTEEFKDTLILKPAINSKLASGEYGFYLVNGDTAYIYKVPDSADRIKRDYLKIPNSMTCQPEITDNIDISFNDLSSMDVTWFTDSQIRNCLAIGRYTDCMRTTEFLFDSKLIPLAYYKELYIHLGG